MNSKDFRNIREAKKLLKEAENRKDDGKVAFEAMREHLEKTVDAINKLEQSQLLESNPKFKRFFGKLISGLAEAERNANYIGKV